MTGGPGAPMQHLVTPTGPASAERRLGGTGRRPFFPLFVCTHSVLQVRLLASWLTGNVLPFSRLPTPPDTLPLGCMERISLLHSGRYR